MCVENGDGNLPRQNRVPGSAGSGVSRERPAAAEVTLQNGIVSLVIGGTPISPLVVDLDPATGSAQITAAAEAGVSLFRINGLDLGWRGAAQFDYQELEVRIEALLSRVPNASVMLRVSVDPPAWWLHAHADECAQYLEHADDNRGAAVSWASHRWRNEAGSALARLVRHVHTQAYATQCVGWQLSAGESGEWRYPNAADLPDVSPAMTAHFRQWAVEKYRRNTGLLRKAWFDARGEFASIACPGARERRRGDLGVLRNPQRSKRILDFYESLSDAQNSAALHFCAQARKACAGRALVGLSYATISECGAEPEDGHGLPETVLDSPDVQFLANRGASDGSYPRALTGSMSLRGKLLFHSPAPDCSPGQAVAVALTHQIGLILPPSTAPDTLRAAAEAMERALPLSGKVRRRASQIAVVMDMANRHYIAEPAAQASPLNAALLTSQIEEITRIGTPLDLYLLSDLFHPKFPDYKVVLFLNTFYLSVAERRRVDARVKRSGTTAVWLWGAGLIGEDGLGAEFGRRLCGQKVRAEANSISLRVRIAEGNDPLTWGYHPGTQLGADRAISPAVTIADKTITRLGANTDNKTVFAVRRAEDWTSVVFGTSHVPAGLLRNLLRAAGAHIYSDMGEAAIIQADARSIAVTAPRGGQIQISLPGRYDVTDGWANKVVARGVSEFTATARPGETAYYELNKRGGETPEPRKQIPTKGS